MSFGDGFNNLIGDAAAAGGAIADAVILSSGEALNSVLLGLVDNIAIASSLIDSVNDHVVALATGLEGSVIGVRARELGHLLSKLCGAEAALTD